MKTAGRLAALTAGILLVSKAIGWSLGLLRPEVAMELMNVLLALGGAALVLLLAKAREGR